MKNALIENIVRLHTTELGAERIRRNLGLTEDPVEWCRSKILDKNAVIGRQGKNWYVSVDGCVITVNAGGNFLSSHDGRIYHILSRQGGRRHLR